MKSVAAANLRRSSCALFTVVRCRENQREAAMWLQISIIAVCAAVFVVRLIARLRSR